MHVQFAKYDPLNVHMKLTFVSVLILFQMTAGLSLAQSDHLVVTSRKITYKRIGKDVPDFKNTFEVNYPVIRGGSNSAARKRIVHAIDYWRIFQMSLTENLGNHYWLSSFDYEIKYNQHSILDIWLTVEGVGAYPDSSIRYLVFDIRTGKRLTIIDLFKKHTMSALLKKLREKMRVEEVKAIKINDALKETLAVHRENLRDYHQTPNKLVFKHLSGFSINDFGVTFHYDYGFAHSIEAIEPPGEFFLTYTELKPFIRKDGLLARFVR